MLGEGDDAGIQHLHLFRPRPPAGEQDVKDSAVDVEPISSWARSNPRTSTRSAVGWAIPVVIARFDALMAGSFRIGLESDGTDSHRNVLDSPLD